MILIDQQLSGITGHPDFKKPLVRVKYERHSGQNQPKGFAYGFDIYEDQQTRTGDGRYIGAMYARTPISESSVWVFRSLPTSDTPSPSGRIGQLAERLRDTAATLQPTLN